MGLPRIHRYPTRETPQSGLDPLDDVLDWITYLRSDDYVVRLLTTHHGISLSEAKSRARLIAPHVRDALAFIYQAKDSPEEVCFVPLYYALLNLAKVAILCGPHYLSLPSHRWHGVAYEVFGKDSQNILTETITLKKGGALALFYQTLMAVPWPADRIVSMAEVYPYMADIAQEYSMATGKKAKVAQFEFSSTPPIRGRVRVRVKVHHPKLPTPLKPRQVSGCRGLRPDASDPSVWFSIRTFRSAFPWDQAFSTMFDRRLIYHDDFKNLRLPFRCGRFAFPEELPILLAFFHLSSIARYKPDFLYSSMDSLFWPMIATSRRHCLYKFLLLFWSNIHKTSFYIKNA